MDTISTITYLAFEPTSEKKIPIDHAFRLCKWQHLLHLEFYFVNVSLQNNILLPKGKGRSFMIVRLPQQHIAEQSYDSKGEELPSDLFNNWTAVTRIAGYSFVAFRIFLDKDEEQEEGMVVTEKNLLDWNNPARYSLQIQPRGFDTPFFDESDTANTYPLAYQEIQLTEEEIHYKYSPYNFPAVNGDPTSLFEIPWRMLMSPKLPDQDRFEFHWEFPLLQQENKYSIWTTSLILREKGNFSKAAVDGIPKIELMMAGSPDYRQANQNADDIFIKDDRIPGKGRILPDANHRRKLVDLYIQYKLTTRTDKLTFSPLGVSTFLAFKNERIKDTLETNDLESWSQLISFGRDEKVEVVNVILEKETGMKMLHVRTSKRVTRHGTFYLDYREYIMPLEESKDYQAHKSLKTTSNTKNVTSKIDANKFRSPFKKISFLEKKPKRIVSLTETEVYDGSKFQKLAGQELQGFYFPQVRLASGEVKDLTFEFIGTDWHDNEIRFNKNIQAITSEVNKFKTESDSLVTMADNFFNKAENSLRNTILFDRKKIGYAVKETVNDITKNVPSTLPTISLLMQGQLKDLDGAIDFFNEFASIPQLAEAEVYVEAVTKLVGKDLPIKIQYARDYLESQINDRLTEGVGHLRELVTLGNEAKVFAEVLPNSQDTLKGVIRNMANEMGGFVNPELPVEYLTYLKDPKRIPPELLDNLTSIDGIELDRVQDTYNDILLISEAVRKQWKETRQILPSDYFKELDAKILGSISLAEILGTDFETPRLTSLPDKAVYNFITDKIYNLDGQVVKFYARNPKTTLQIYFEKSTKDLLKYTTFTRLANFAIGINIASVEALKINFSEFKISSSNTQPKKTEVNIDRVEFGGALKFLSDLAAKINLPGNGLRILPSPQRIEIGYTFALPSIASPSFNFSNLKFDIGLKIPLPSPASTEIEPIAVAFSINAPDDKFLITIGIFGGRGHFLIETTTKGLRRVEASLEFGGYFGINLGIASGHVFLFAGIYYQYEETGNMTVAAYLICGGGVTVFGFISVYVNFVMTLLYQSAGNYFEGSAAVKYSIKIGFFKKSFTLSYRKRFSGNQSQTFSRTVASKSFGYEEGEPNISSLESASASKPFSEIYSKTQWSDYCETFSY